MDRKPPRARRGRDPQRRLHAVDNPRSDKRGKNSRNQRKNSPECGRLSPDEARGIHVCNGDARPRAIQIPHFSMELRAVFTNKGPVGTYRAFGMTQATFARERMIDLLAQKIGMDPAQVRLQNLVAPEDFPYINPAGLPYDSGNYRSTLEKALETRCLLRISGDNK